MEHDENFVQLVCATTTDVAPQAADRPTTRLVMMRHGSINEMENPPNSKSDSSKFSVQCETFCQSQPSVDLVTIDDDNNNPDEYNNYYHYELMSSGVHNKSLNSCNPIEHGNVGRDGNENGDEEEDALSTGSRPTSLREFFLGFWSELQSLTHELVQYSKAKSWKKKVLTVLVMTTSVLVFYDLLFGDYIIDRLEHFIQWMTENSTKAVVAFITLFVVSTLIMIPPTLLVFGAGYAFSQAIGFGWGVLAAILSCSIGSCVGATLAFWRSRYMMRDLIYIFSKRYPLVRAADRALKRKGFHVMLLLRLCPLIPFNGLNYCCGITGVRLEDFAMSLIGILPFQIFTVFVGATAGSLALRDQSKYNPSQEVGFVILIASGCAFGIIALVYIWKLVKKELRKELELTPAQFEQALHPIEQEVHQQGGIEPSIEIKHVVVQAPVPISQGDKIEPWLESDEEWFWVWA